MATPTSAAAMRYQHAAQSRDEAAQWIEAVAQSAKTNPWQKPTPIGQRR